MPTGQWQCGQRPHLLLHAYPVCMQPIHWAAGERDGVRIPRIIQQSHQPFGSIYEVGSRFPARLRHEDVCLEGENLFEVRTKTVMDAPDPERQRRIPSPQEGEIDVGGLPQSCVYTVSVGVVGVL